MLCRGDRIIIPKSIWKEILSKIHDGHFGIGKALKRAQESVFWPGITNDIQQTIEKCEICAQHKPQKTFKMIQSSTPERPWQRIAIDFFEHEKSTYIAIIDYYSRFIELASVKTLTTNELIKKCKQCFARHGVPEEIMSDSGTQFTGKEWETFAKVYDFKIKTSSPHYHQSNGEVERAVQTLKSILKKNEDPHLALLTYLATPNKSGRSPSELLMEQKLRTRLPVKCDKLDPQIIEHDDYRVWDENFHSQQAEQYNKQHQTVEEAKLPMGQRVYIPDQRTQGIVGPEVASRSYTVTTSKGIIRRNSSMLRPLPEPEKVNVELPEEHSSSADTPATEGRSRYGRVYKPVKRFNE